MAYEIDARGLACPQPVILVKKALQSEGRLLVLVDNDTAQKNVAALAEKLGAACSSERGEYGIRIRIEKSGQIASPKPAGISYVVVVPDEGMGRGDVVLGSVLIRGFFHALNETDEIPGHIIFFNSGVKLAVEGSPVLADLRELEKKGAVILACGTCLTHFGIKDKLAAGGVSNMYDIVETMTAAGKIVQL